MTGKRKAATTEVASRSLRTKKEVEKPVAVAPASSSKSKGGAEPKGKRGKAAAKPASERPKEAELKAVEALIEQIDFEPIRNRLEAKYGWSDEHQEWAVKEYKRFLTMRKFYEDINATPEVDVIWAEHVIHTRAYLEDVTRIFGEFLHHEPIHADEDLLAKVKIAERTAKLYQDFFGEEMLYLYPTCDHCGDDDCDDSNCGEDRCCDDEECEEGAECAAEEDEEEEKAE